MIQVMADGFDEQMGMGRDSRTLASGRTNGEILARAINRVGDIVRKASEKKNKGHATTQFVIWADMVVRICTALHSIL